MRGKVGRGKAGLGEASEPFSSEELEMLAQVTERTGDARTAIVRCVEAMVLAPDSTMGRLAQSWMIHGTNEVTSPVAYVLWDGDLSHPVKIGCSNGAVRRCRDVQKEHPEYPGLDVVLTVFGYELAEEALHDLFKEYRIEGEWFEAEPVIRWAASIGYVHDRTDELPPPMQKLALTHMDWFSEAARRHVDMVHGWGDHAQRMTAS